MTLVLVRTENPTPIQAAAENRLILAVPAMTPPVIDGIDTTDDEWESAHRLAVWADNILGVANKDRSFVNVGATKRLFMFASSIQFPPNSRCISEEYRFLFGVSAQGRCE